MITKELICQQTEIGVQRHGNISNARFAECKLRAWHGNHLTILKFLVAALEDDAHVLKLLVVERVCKIELKHDMRSKNMLHTLHSVLSLGLSQCNYTMSANWFAKNSFQPGDDVLNTGPKEANWGTNLRCSVTAGRTAAGAAALDCSPDAVLASDEATVKGVR